MKEQKRQRQALMEALYQFDFYDSNISKLESTIAFTEHKERFLKIVEVYKNINEIIEASLENYTLKRLSMVDRAILRLATYEMKYEELPKEIAINEALELTKMFTNLDDHKQVKFNNKVLDTIASKIGL